MHLGVELVRNSTASIGFGTGAGWEILELDYICTGSWAGSFVLEMDWKHGLKLTTELKTLF